MANQLSARLPPVPRTQARRLARLTRDRFHLGKGAGREVASRPKFNGVTRSKRPIHRTSTQSTVCRRSKQLAAGKRREQRDQCRYHGRAPIRCSCKQPPKRRRSVRHKPGPSAKDRWSLEKKRERGKWFQTIDSRRRQSSNRDARLRCR